MALKFIGERTVGTLNGMKSGFVKDDLYRVYDAGILVPGGVAVDHGDFVSWDGTKWVREADIKIARSDEITSTNSNIAPDYTKTTYPANSYVMQGGVLYTNPNAIETAEDWNPAHWTQTTVAEMMAGAQKKYVSVTKTATYDSDNKRFMLDVNQKEVITVTLSTSSISAQSKLYLNLGTTDDALIIVKKSGSYTYRLESIAYSRQMSEIIHNVVQRVNVTAMDTDLSTRILLTNEWEEEHGDEHPVIPTNFDNTELLGSHPDDNNIITSVADVGSTLQYDTLWMIRVIGDTVLVATNENYV